jgi:UDPglucose--hexose-1-phosphate uridylyltransferase
MDMRSELRKDPAGGSWVIIAAGRSRRPNDFLPPMPRLPDPAPVPASCPFCAGHESRTPPEVAAVRRPGTSPDGPGWRVRVVPNKFPALTRGRAPRLKAHGLFESMNGVGVHELVIETPDHRQEFPDLDPGHAVDVLRTCRERIALIETEAPTAYVQLFKNRGRDAGASLSHPHVQIVAIPIVPKRVEEEIAAAEAFLARTGECLFCRLIEDETAAGERLIFRNGAFLAAAPFASRYPFEMHIHPRLHSSRFSRIPDEELAALAETLRTVLVRLREAVDDPPYNILLHQAPRPGRGDADRRRLESAYHWHLEILPVLTHVAGFEWGTGFTINPVPPEDAASVLRG